MNYGLNSAEMKKTFFFMTEISIQNLFRYINLTFIFSKIKQLPCSKIQHPIHKEIQCQPTSTFILSTENTTNHKYVS